MEKPEYMESRRRPFITSIMAATAEHITIEVELIGGRRERLTVTADDVARVIELTKELDQGSPL